MTNKMLVNVGDVLADRDSRREGRLVKVIHVDPEFVTVETIQDSFNATTSTVGRSTDVANGRLGKAYRINTKAVVEPLVGVLSTEDDTFDEGWEEDDEYYDYDDEESYPEDEYDEDEYVDYDVPVYHEDDEDDEEDEEVTETNLEGALNSAGFFYVTSPEIIFENLSEVSDPDEFTSEELVQIVVSGIREGVFGL